MLGGVWARLVAEGLTRLVCRVFGLVKFEVNAEAAESPRVKRPRAGSEIAEKDFQALRAVVAAVTRLGMAPTPAGLSPGRRPHQTFSAISEPALGLDPWALCGLCVDCTQGTTGTEVSYIQA